MLVRGFIILSGILFTAWAVFHFLRMTFQLQLFVGPWFVPNWVSGVSVVLGLLLAYIGFHILDIHIGESVIDKTLQKAEKKVQEKQRKKESKSKEDKNKKKGESSEKNESEEKKDDGSEKKSEDSEGESDTKEKIRKRIEEKKKEK